MPGSEWTNDEPGNRDDSRPLDASEVAPSFAPRAPFDQAHAQPTEPAMAHVSPQQDPDSDETGSDESPKPSAFFKVLALLKKIPLPSMGSERHEMLSHVNRTHAAEPHAAEAHARHEPERSAPRLSLIHLKRETKVGIAILLSFVLIVTAMVIKKGWIGGAPMMAMDGPGKTDAEAKAKKDAETKKDPEPPKETAKPESKPASEPGSTDKPSSELPSIGTGEHKPGDPAVAPKSEGDSSKLPPAVVDASSTAGLTLPDTKTAELPPATGADSMLPPVTASETKPAPTIPEPTPSGLPEMKNTPPPPTETKPAPPEINPGAGSGLPTIPVIPTEPPPTKPEPAAPPIVADPVATAATTTTSTTPVPSEKTPSLESVPSNLPPPMPTPTASAPIEPAATTTSMGGATAAAAPSSPAPANESATLGAGWVFIPNGGRRIPGSSPIVSTPMDSDFGQVDRPVATSSRVTDGPRPSQDLDADQVEPVFHTVQPGENFWTISKLYYNSPRYYKSLHAANKQQVPNIAKLYVGTVLQIPPPEKLDRSLIERETSPLTKVTKKANPEDLADLAPPIRPRIARADPEAPEPPRRPTYKVKPNDTLRSIARELLGDSRRDKEIFTLNSEILDDPRDLAPGTIITLPEDAKIARGGR